MNNFIRGTLLGLVAGISLFWYEGISDYFPAILAAILFVGILIPLESQERRMAELLKTMKEMVATTREIQRRLDESKAVVGVATNQPVSSVSKPEVEPTPFIPTMQHDTSANTPTSQKKRTVDRSLDDVAKKLSSMQRG